MSNTLVRPRVKYEQDRAVVATAFLAGLGMCYYITLGGQLYIGELVLLGYLVLNFKQLATDSLIAYIFIATAIWAAGLAMADLSRGTTLFDAFRGQALVWFLFIDLAAFRLLVAKSIRAIRYLAIGYGLGLCLGYVIQPAPNAEIAFWKFGLGTGITFLVFGLLMTSRFPFVVKVVSLAALSITHLLMGFRSETLIVAITLVIFVGLRKVRSSTVQTTAQKIRLFVLPIAGVVLLSQAYAVLAQGGTLGADAQYKYEVQSARTPLGVAGRPEFIYSSLAIREDPIIGLGSVAADHDGIIRQGLVLESEVGLPLRYPTPTAVPLHSHILGSIAQAGLFALAFWVIVVRNLLAGYSALRGIGQRYGLSLIGPFLLFQTSWDTLFSPLGAVARFQFAFGFVVVCQLLIERNRNEI